MCTLVPLPNLRQSQSQYPTLVILLYINLQWAVAACTSHTLGIDQALRTFMCKSQVMMRQCRCAIVRTHITCTTSSISADTARVMIFGMQILQTSVAWSDVSVNTERLSAFQQTCACISSACNSLSHTARHDIHARQCTSATLIGLQMPIC